MSCIINGFLGFGMIARLNRFAIAALFLFSLLSPIVASAEDQEALTFDTIGAGSDYYQGTYSLGWRFQANSNLRVTALGFYDDLRNGLTASHEVGIFDYDNCQLLATATVSPSDPLEGSGFFRYHSITPVTLSAGHNYYVAGLTNDGDRYAISVSTMTPNSAINYWGFVIFGNTQETTTLRCPNGASAEGFKGDYGPNFKFGDSVAVPTPSPTPESNKRPTKITLFCNRKGVLLEQASCSATVADASTSFPRITPTGTIDFVTRNGFFPASSSCFPVKPDLSPDGIASCTAEFQIPNGFPIGAQFPIDATYSGDATFSSSTTSHKLIQAGCVGTTENPCSGAVALSFNGNGLQILKNALKAVIGCGTTAGMGLATTDPLDLEAGVLAGCNFKLDTSVELATMLHDLGLTPDLCSQLGSAISNGDANSDATLKALKEMFKKAANDQPYLQQIDIDPTTLNSELLKYIRKAQKDGRRGSSSYLESIVFGDRAATKLRVVSLGSGFGKIAANLEKSVNVKLNNFGKRFTKALKKAGIGTIPLTFALKSTRFGALPAGVQKKVSASGSIDVTF